ncbi:VOC family protein [Halobacterium bonnevillei]|jgi:glyoxylase I family protein|uniref:VOC family protein n=1 Tax=Halobacterium bonnevillei TaxID=2692200 RepID=A0A6B0SE87_9EURY|nr:VOC family protein [Halobacterium bonnevillei]MXR20034.1 VOC family protein [Halobacterium bonnevillei]
MIEDINHIEIEASDAEEMVAFFEKLGFEEHRETEHHGASYEMKPAGAEKPVFEIHTVKGEETPGINHLAFQVDDIQGATKTLEEEDVSQVSNPYYVEPTDRTIVNFRDPDGRRFQFVSEGDKE